MTFLSRFLPGKARRVPAPTDVLFDRIDPAMETAVVSGEWSSETHFDEDLETTGLDVVRRVRKHMFAEHLVRMGIVERSKVDMALAEAKITKERIGEVLVRNGDMRRSQLVDILAVYNPQALSDGKMTRTRVPTFELRRHSTVISAETPERLYVSTIQDETVVAKLLKNYYPDKEILFTAFDPEKAFSFYERLVAAELPVEDEDVPDHEKLRRLILFPAMNRNASDIHIIPRMKTYSVFVRVLGDLQHLHEGTLEEHAVVIAQIKNQSHIDLAQKRLGQDGNMSADYDGKVVNMRTATVPIVGGEAAVIRILDTDRVDPALGSLGITEIAAWRAATSRKNGLIIITGETGSGKTTTLRSTILEFDRLKRRIWTAEDPVEYKIPFIGQVNINHMVGLHYSAALKNFMRADGDILILGEIRDEETARHAIKAAETGHLVIATLHNTSISTSVDRLKHLGIEPYELRHYLRGVLVQTLIKSVCKACKGTLVIDGFGCPRCAADGYDSQTVASECVYLKDSDAVDTVIAIADGTLKENAIYWRTMLDDAIDKMAEGITTIDEVRSHWGVEADARCLARNLDPEDYHLPPSGMI